MCTGPRKPSPAHMDAEAHNSSPGTAGASLLLELSASDDVVAFKRAVEEDGHSINAAALWYGRSLASPPRRMGFELRTPLMIAAAHGSASVLSYILSSNAVDVNRRCGSDGSTALHCAAAGGSPEAARMLLDGSADVDALDSSGCRPADMIARRPSSSSTRTLEVMLKASSLKAEEGAPAKQAGEKREYPMDATLPDIKNGIYGTDEFRMYAFKIKPCSRAYSHDWTECPFVHPGENARRRDPRKFLYSCVPCPEFRKGSCRNGDACEYAHGVFESWLHPAQYRTRLCKDETGCNRRVCFFAHKPEELRSVNHSAPAASGLGISPPRALSLGSCGVSSLDMGAAMRMMQPGSAPGSPVSPSASSWMIQPSSMMSPNLQLPSSRLRSTLSSRDLDLGLDLLELECYRHKLINEIATSATTRFNWAAAGPTTSQDSDYSDLVCSLNASDYSPPIVSQLPGLSLKPKTGGAAPAGARYHQNMGQQVHSGYGSSITPSSLGSDSSSIGFDYSLARASAFAKRSQSFCERGAMPRHPSPPTVPSGLSNWGSPDGKLDWGIQGEELNKLRKAASFNYRSNSRGLATTTAAAQALYEPDLSSLESRELDDLELVSRLNQQQQLFAEQQMFPVWAEQMYMEQEQMVA